MHWTFWQSGGADTWAVCDGPGPLNVAGYIIWRNGAWFAEGHEPAFLNTESAAAAITTEPLQPDGDFYIIAHESEVRVVFTYPEVIKIHEQQGWHIIGRSKAR